MALPARPVRQDRPELPARKAIRDRLVTMARLGPTGRRVALLKIQTKDNLFR